MTQALAPLRVPAFRWLTLGGSISRVGSTVAPIALAFAVLDVTASIAALGIVVGSRSIANVAFLLFGGVLADRLPRGVLLVGSSVASAATQAGVAVLLVSGHASILNLAVLSAVNGAVSAVSQPAAGALVPQTLPPDLLPSGNALSRLGINGAGVGGTAIAGLVVALFGSAAGIALDAATFAIAAVCFALVRVPGGAQSARTERTSFRSDLVAGWSAFTSRQWLWVIVVAFTVVNATFAGSTGVLGPAVADRTIGRPAWGFTLAAEGIGLLIGGLLALRIRPSRPVLFGTLCVLPLCLEPAVLGLFPHVLVLVPVFVICGIGVELFEVSWQTSLQTHVPPELLARVISYDLFGSFLAIPLGQLVAAPASMAFGLVPTLVGAAVIAVGAIVLAALSPGVRGLRAIPPA